MCHRFIKFTVPNNEHNWEYDFSIYIKEMEENESGFCFHRL